MTILSCGDARALLLDAEPALLREPDASPLGVHLRSCTACARAAAAIVAGNDELSFAIDELAAAAPAPKAAAATARAGRARMRMPFRAIIPLAAAATLLLMTGRGVFREQAPLPPLLLPPVAVPSTVVVNAGTTGTVAVMKTSNPGITIVWHLESTQ